MKINKVSKIHGILTVPADKSITHRAIMLSCIADGTSYIHNYLESEDCLMTQNAFKNMGVNIIQKNNSLIIKGVGLNGLQEPSTIIYAGNSGTTTRLLSGILAGQKFSSTISGDDSLSSRPMKRIIEPLSLMGANISAYNNNYLPLKITSNGVLQSINYISKVASAQVKSCILFAGLYAQGITSITEPIKSRNHSELMLKSFGADIIENNLTISINKCNKLYAQEINISGDISSASFFIVAALIIPNSEIKILNVNINETRNAILEVLKNMGANITLDNIKNISGEQVADIHVKSSNLHSTNINSNIIPRLIDEIPIIALCATQAQGTTIVSGASELKIKESNRLKAISSQLNKMGANIIETEDGLNIKGITKLHGAVVDSYKDHRIAMMLSIAGLICNEQTEVLNSDCVNISFKNFYEVLKQLCK